MRKFLTAALIAATAGCVAPARRTVAPAVSIPGAARVAVVLEDAAGSSGPPGFETLSAAALRDDGTRSPLEVVEDAAGAPGGDRLWLAGPVPEGTYRGIEVALRAGTGGSAPEAVVVDAPFVVRAEAGVVLAARSAPASGPESVPRIEARVRTRPAPGLYGLATVSGWDALALFDKRSGALAAVVAVGAGPAGIAVDPERLQAYVALAGDDAVAVVDLPEARVRERVVLRTGDAPREVALTPDGRTLVVANPGSDTVSFVDTASAVEVERVPVQGRPVSVLLDRSGARVLVLAERSSVVTVLSVAGRGVVGVVPVEAGPFRARFSGRNDERIVVAHRDSPYLSVVDSRELAVTGRVYVGSGARALEVDPRSGRIFLARGAAGRVEVFDPNSLLPLAEWRVPGEVAWLAVESEGNHLGVLLQDPPGVRLVGILGGEPLARVPLGPGGGALAFVQGGSRP